MTIKVTTDVDFADLAISVRPRVARAVNRVASRLQDNVRANAPDDPDTPPDYLNSIRVIPARDFGDVIVASVGTNAPQGWRLEQGFIGIDSLGRRVHQSPRPHWFPAMPAAESDLAEEVTRAVTD